MSASYKVVFERQDGSHASAEELVIVSEQELTDKSPEVLEKAKQQANGKEVKIISVVPVP
ncbi:MAG: hypothetical protein E6560_08785 [Yersiniaceae bacterium]|uniref:Uncharacterized protein n=1 Tax=Chimaeribacter coloradensis TaxID=2060068 RepID=A0A2N5DY81_9GAMM|nr:hypothetical protein [Chimaeribacter coloradensis]MDU6411041.1 hypothetical protein [Yersiniaceae bacterium]PLR32454.1 hypothetical protein CYR32_15390 [Chimaeribacter coloradensis]